MQGRKLVVLADGDDSILNSLFEKLTIIIFDKYGEWLSSHVDNPDSQEVKEKIEAIVREILFLTELDENKKVVTNFHSEVIAVHKASLIKKAGFTDETEENKQKYLQKATNNFLHFIYQFGKSGQDLHRALLYAANLKFFDEFITLILEKGYQKFAYESYSNRVTLSRDACNAERGRGSFILACDRVVEMFNALLQSEGSNVVCEYTGCLAPDFFNNLPHGETAKRIRKALLEPDNAHEIDHPKSPHDRTKYMLTYSLSHFFEDADIFCVEDMKEFLDVQRKRLINHSDLLPRNVRLSFLVYSNQMLIPFVMRQKASVEEKKYYVQGTGQVDRNIAENLRRLTKLSSKWNERSDKFPVMNAAVTLRNKLKMDKFKSERVLVTASLSTVTRGEEGRSVKVEQDQIVSVSKFSFLSEKNLETEVEHTVRANDEMKKKGKRFYFLEERKTETLPVKQEGEQENQGMTRKLKLLLGI